MGTFAKGALAPLVAAIALASGLSGCAAFRPAPERPSDWLSHEVCGPDTRPGRNGARTCLEVIELAVEPRERRAVAVLVPGMFQNAASFDLLPEQGISFARFLVSRGVKVYFTHVRGIGKSELPDDSTLDDVAIDDLPKALAFVAAREKTKVIAIGQSQGSMTLQASLAGLARCGDGVCFEPAIARARQERVHSLGLFTGSLAFRGDQARLAAIAQAGALLGPAAGLLVDEIPGRRPGLALYALAGPGPYDFLFRAENVTPAAAEAMIDRTVEASPPGFARQLADAVDHGYARSGKERWADHLHNVQVPVVQTTFGEDPLSPPGITYRESFKRLGSKTKRFRVVRGQSHEDWMMAPALHRQHWLTVEDLIDPR